MWGCGVVDIPQFLGTVCKLGHCPRYSQRTTKSRKMVKSGLLGKQQTWRDEAGTWMRAKRSWKLSGLGFYPVGLY
jgi:hypothetical protein